MGVLGRALILLGVHALAISAYSVPPNSVAPQLPSQLSPQCTDKSTDDCRAAREQNKCFDVFYSQLMDMECPFTCRVDRCTEEIGRALGPTEGSGANDEVDIFDYVTNHAGSGSGSGEKKKKKKCKNKLLAGHEGDCAAAAAYGNCYRGMWRAIMKRYCAATCPRLCKRKKKKKKKKKT